MDTATDSKNDKDKEKKKFGGLLVERYMECLLDPKDIAFSEQAPCLIHQKIERPSPHEANGTQHRGRIPQERQLQAEDRQALSDSVSQKSLENSNPVFASTTLLITHCLLHWKMLLKIETWDLRLKTQRHETLDSWTLKLWDFETWEFEKIQIQIWPEWISI